MKHRPLLVALLLSLASCSMAPPPPVPTFSAIDDVGLWIRGTAETPGHITYASDPLGGAWDAWQTPEETLERRAGDCEDISILWLYLVNESFGEKGELVICDTSKGCHACARLNGKYFYDIEGQTVIFTLSYDEAMNTAKVKTIKEIP
jgi:hypothetical protein